MRHASQLTRRDEDVFRAQSRRVVKKDGFQRVVVLRLDALGVVNVDFELVVRG